MDEKKIAIEIERRRELADRNVGNVVSLFERRQDLRNLYEPEEMVAEGFRYVSIGRPEGNPEGQARTAPAMAAGARS